MKEFQSSENTATSCCARSMKCSSFLQRLSQTRWWFLLSAFVVFLDQISKYAANQFLLPYQPEPLMPMLNFTLAYNTGAAFNFLSGTGPWHLWFFMGFSLLVSLGLMVWVIQLPRHDRMQLWAVSLILGGAIGNLIDRLNLGYVIDFIDVYYKNHHWPIFNLADSAISIGTALLIIDLCWRKSGE